MNSVDFDQLCRDASLELGLVDTGSLGRGFTVLLEGLPFEAAFREGSDGFTLMMEAGTVPESRKAAVFGNLLTVQTLTWHLPGLRFGFHPQRQTVVQCVDIKFRPEVDAAWLAGLMRTLAAQAPQLRKLLADEVDAQDSVGTVGGAVAALLDDAYDYLQTVEVGA